MAADHSFEATPLGEEGPETEAKRPNPAVERGRGFRDVGPDVPGGTGGILGGVPGA